MPDEHRARQLTFDLARAPSYGADDFLVSASNEAARGWIDRWPDWPHRVLILLGPPGSGKSHLAAIWAQRADAKMIGTVSSPAGESETSTMVLEDADRIGASEAELFHLLNTVIEDQGWLLLTARTPPELWGVRTPDLLSRLRLAARATIETPDAALIRAVIVKLFDDRQILISEDVVAYAALHCEQSLEAAAAFVAAVDEEALAAGRRITRPLAARLLTELTERGSPPDA